MGFLRLSSGYRQFTVNATRHDAGMSDPSPLVHAAIARLVDDDPLAPSILTAVAADNPDSFDAHAALALVVEAFDDAIEHAKRLAANRRERQHLAIVRCYLHDDRSRGSLLAREHLAEFPDDLVVSWLSSKQ
jgi:hypothetical protein